MTPNQNVIIANVEEADKARMEALLAQHGPHSNNRSSVLRLNAMFCVGLPTCGLAMAKASVICPR